MIKCYADTNIVTDLSFWEHLKQEIYEHHEVKTPTKPFTISFIGAYAEDLLKRCYVHGFNTVKVDKSKKQVSTTTSFLNSIYKLNKE